MKKDNGILPPPVCMDLTCHATVILIDTDGDGIPDHEERGCASGGSDCSDSLLHEAKISEFYDKTLDKATKKINEILKDVQKNAKYPKGYKLSFIHTTQGVLLSWVDHGASAPNGAQVITKETQGEEAFVKALQIKDWKKKK